MKKSSIAFLLITGLALVAASSAFATATNSTLASASISAATARIGGSGAYTTLVGPQITESDGSGFPNGSVILNPPPGFEFGTNVNSVTVTVTGIGTGTDMMINTNNSTTGQGAVKTVTPTTNSITIWATSNSFNNARSTLTWSNITVRPVNGTPLSSGTITCSGTSGGIASSVNQGTLTEVAGPASKLAITQSPATNFAGSSLLPAVQVRVQDSVGNNVGTNNVSITVTLDHGSFDFGGTTDVTGTNGAVVFSTLQINTASNYLLSATASGFTDATPVPLTIIPTAPFSIQFIQDAPSNAVISSIFSPSVVVKVADFFGNGINTQTVNMAMIGGGSLSGTTARVTGTSGLATFNDLSTATAGTNKNLVASMTSPALSATGATFSVSAGAASKLGFTISPTTTTAGVTMASVKVQVQDIAGNSFATNGVSIFLALSPGNLVSGTTNLATEADGSVTFTNLLINVAGNYTLTATAPDTSLTATPATPFTIVPGPITTFQFTQDAPASVTAGQIFTPNVTVQLADAFSNAISNKTVTLSLNAGGPLLGTTSRATDGSGVATFTNLSINASGTNYALIASVTGPSMSVTGSTFVITTAAPNKLAYTTPPPATNAPGVTIPSFVVQIQDQFNNNVSTSDVPIAVSLNTGNFTSGTTNMNSAADGSATFNDLLLNTSGSYTLTASSAGLTSAVRSLAVTNGPITVFQITQDAPAANTAGTIFSPAVTVQITDAFNNPYTNKTVTLTLNGGGALLGTTSRATDLTGIASFTNLSVNVAGTNYSLTASITSPTMSVTGSVFVVTNAAPSKVVYSTLPATTNTAGSTMSTFVVRVQDQFSNNVSTNGVPIRIVLNTGSFASGTTNLDTIADGSATFTDLVINVAGTYTMSAMSTGLTSAARLITVVPGPYAITFQQDAPSLTTAGVIFSPPVAVRIADAFNNVLSNTTVSLTLNGGGALSGTTSRLTTNTGVATFTNLSVNVAGTNYSLTASITSPALSVTGSTFVVNAAAATKLAFSTAPVATNTAGVTLPTFVVQVRDAFNNNISTSDVPITISLNTGTFSAGTPTTNTLADGSATFSDLVITNSGNNVLTASATGLTSTNKTITILPDTANTIAFVQGPAASMAAGAVFTNTVKIIDQFNNGLSNVTVTLSPNGFATLNGTLSRQTAGNGVATFNNLSVNTPGTGYSITATGASLSTTSSTFDVTVGAIHHYLVSASSSQARGVAFPVTVTAQDIVSNTVPDNSTVVTMSSSSVNVTFDVNPQTLSNGTFVVNAQDNIPETITITGTDTNSKTGSTNITINAATGDYRSLVTGPWNTASTWQIWDGANWVTASTPPAGGSGTNITILSTHRVTNNVAVALSGTLVTQGSLTFNGGSIAVGSGGLVLNSGTINSAATNLIFNSGGTYQHAQNGGTIPTAAYNSNSLLRVTGITSTIATLPTSGLNGNVEWNCPNQTVATAIILPSATTIGGNFNIVSTGSGSIIGGGSTARNLSVGGNMNVQGGVFNALGGNGSTGSGLNLSVSVAQNLTVSGGTFSLVVSEDSGTISAALTVGGNLAINSGNLTVVTGNSSTLSSSYSMTVSGNTTVAGGTLNLTDATVGSSGGVTAALRGNLTISGGTISRGGTLPATVNFAGTSPQTYSKSAGTISGAVNFAILSGATVNFGTSLLDGSSGTFSLNSGGAIGIGDPAGITTSGAAGNIRVTGTRTYSIGGTYIYNGATAQTTSNGLPATVRSLIVSNSADAVTLSANVAISNDLRVVAGTLDLGSFTANRITSGGTNTVANGATMKIGGTNTLPSNYATRLFGATSTIEYGGAAQNVSAQTYGHLATSGSGQKSLQTGATAIAGNLSIGSGTTFNPGTNNFSLAGNLTNDGSMYTYGILTQTITFNGASPQSVSGAASTAFNNVALNSGSVLNLTGNHTALNLTIAGVPQAAGTWGATGSGATNIDDTHFQGTGILTVTHVAFNLTFLDDAPAVVPAGTIFSPPVRVQLSDSILDFVTNRTITLSLNSGTLNGTLSQITDTNGVATFTNLSVNATGSYSLTATVPSLSVSATGTTFSVVSTTATKLTFTTAPPVTNAPGVTIPTFVVQLQDQFNNNVSTDSVPISVTLNTGNFTSGTSNLTSAVDGSATFFDLLLNTAGNYILTASSPGLTSAARSLVITNGPIAVFQFTQDAPATTSAGTIFSPAVTVQIADAFNNPYTNKTVNLTLVGGATLNGTVSRATSATGVATYTNLNITVPGTNYALTANITSPTMSVTGSTFVVTTGAATKLVYTTLPAATNVAGVTLPTFVVQVQDAFSNNVASSGVPITMVLNTNSFASGSTNLSTDPDGSATFFDLVVNAAGNYTMSATSPGLTNANRAITILPTTASNIAFVQQPPAVTNAGSTFTPSVTVKVTDVFNNAISNINVIASLNGAGTLNGTLTRATAGTGIATFNNLSVNQVGTNYTLTAATTNPVLSVNSSSFDITVGPIDHYLVTAFSNQTRGVAFPVTVTAQDVASNNITSDNSTVVTMSSNPANVTFDVNPQTLSNGTFTVTAQDNYAEIVTVTATDANNKTGSAAVTVNAVSGDYRSAVTGPWNAATTWQIWDGTNWVAASTTPAGGAGTNITILSTHRVTNNVAVALSGSLITQGSLSFSGGSITVNSGGILRNSGTVSGSTSALIFTSGSTYQHAWTNNPGTIPTATWNTNSTCAMVGYTTLDNSAGGNNGGGLSQTFWNFTWDCPNQTGIVTFAGSLNTVNGNFTLTRSGTGAVRLGGTGSGNLAIGGNYSQTGGKLQITVSADRTVTVGGSFSLSGGTFDLTGGGAGTLTVAGNYSHTGGTLTETLTSSPTAGVLFNGTGIQVLTSGGSNSGTINFTVNSGATVMMGTNLLGLGSSGTFTMSTGGTLGIGDPLGITTSGAIGNVRVTGTRTYGIGANYIYNGTTDQVTSNGLPATVRSLTVSNTAGIVTLTSNVAVSNDLRVVAGTFDLGSFTANRATNGGTNVVANGATMKIGGAGTLPSNYATRTYGPNSTIEYGGAAQNVSAQTYGHLVTSGSSTKTVQPGTTAIAGNLTIGSGTTLVSTNNFSLAGNWANNGSGFSASGSQTVTFNGASPQTISGTPMSFNNVALNSGSALNLAYTGVAGANALSIGGTNKLAGTWGATGSGATFVDDTHFQGTTGVLNVLSGPTSTTLLSSSLNPSTYAQSVTFTARVVAVGGIPPATGTITFMEGANTLGSVALSGSPTGLATYATSSFAPGTYAITAVYGGDGNFAGSTSTVLSQQVNAAALLITANSTNKTYGQTVVFAGTEFSVTGLLGTDSVTSVTLNSAGATSGANSGSYDIVPSSAVGYDLSHYSITYSNGTLIVNQASSSTAVGSSANPVCEGAPVHFTATVSSGAGTPTGNVQFKIDAIDFGSPAPLVSGVATSAVTTSLSVTNHTITAVYLGDVNFTGSTSPDFSQSVTAAPAAPTAGNNGPICAGSTLTLTASTVSNATYAWTGPNAFSSSEQNPAISNATTAATGTYSVTVTVGGCTSLAGQTVATVNAIPAAPDAGNDSPTCVGGIVSLTASTVSNATYAWTGPNVFSSSEQNPVISNVTAAAAGTYNVMVTVNGCTSTAGTTIVSINIPPSISTNPASQSVSAGSPVTFTVVATGTSLNYQWRKGGVDISGETASSYNIASTVASDATNYDCVVSNICGVVTSDPATLTVITMTPFEQWQMQYFGCTNCAQAAANTDADGDGQSNFAEFLSGTVPTNSASALHTTSVVRQGVDVLITWATAGGHTNAVQLTTGGYNTNFVDLSSPIIITGSGDTSTNYTDFGGATNAIPRFYRIRLVP